MKLIEEKYLDNLPSDIDEDCIKICKTLNRLPGIKTLESCCGHRIRPFSVLFRCLNLQTLNRLVAALNKKTTDGNWQIIPKIPDGGGSHYLFLLQSEIALFDSYEELLNSLDKLVENILLCFSDDYDSFFEYEMEKIYLKATSDVLYKTLNALPGIKTRSVECNDDSVYVLFYCSNCYALKRLKVLVHQEKLWNIELLRKGSFVGIDNRPCFELRLNVKESDLFNVMREVKMLSEKIQNFFNSEFDIFFQEDAFRHFDTLIADMKDRLPFGVRIKTPNGTIETMNAKHIVLLKSGFPFIPYLKPHSKLTDSEHLRLYDLTDTTLYEEYAYKKQLDINFLIEKGLALDITTIEKIITK